MENLFFFWGQEDFLINSEIENLKKKYIDKNFEAMAYKRLYEPSFDDLINAIQSLPMMFGNVMHVINVNKFFLSDGENAIDDWSLKRYEDALASKSDKNIIVLRLVIPLDSKKKVDTRKKIYKITSKYVSEKQFPVYRAYDKELPNVINSLGKSCGLKLDSKIISKIIEQIGTNIGIINSELQKLALTIYPQTEPDLKQIEDICSKKDDVFVILQALFNKDTDKALYELKKVYEKTSLPEIMAAIQYSLRNYTVIKANFQNMGKTVLAQRLHIPEFIVEQNYKMMSEISGKELLKLKKNLLEAEYSIKTGDCVNPETSLEMALMEVYDV